MAVKTRFSFSEIPDYETCISMFRKSGISIDAFGLLAMILFGDLDHDNISINKLEGYTGSSRYKIYTALDKLIEFGYCELYKFYDDDGNEINEYMFNIPSKNYSESFRISDKNSQKVVNNLQSCYDFDQKVSDFDQKVVNNLPPKQKEKEKKEKERNTPLQPLKERKRNIKEKEKLFFLFKEKNEKKIEEKILMPMSRYDLVTIDDAFKDVCENQIFRETLMKVNAINESTLNYCINKAKQDASFMPEGVSKAMAYSILKKHVYHVPRVNGSYEERRNKFYYEIDGLCNLHNFDKERADSFYAFWSQMEIPELGIMKFETQSAWSTYNRLRIWMNKN